MKTRAPLQAWQAGVALIAVLWLVAALALIALGIATSVRVEIKAVGQDREQTTANALADAAILLAIAQRQSAQASAILPAQVIAVEFEGHALQVHVSALNGLIDLNAAPQTLLAELFLQIGGLEPNPAQQLAQATVEYRTHPGAGGVKRGFAAPQDLLQVPGFGYGLYVKIKPLVTADLQSGSGKINPSAAPVRVLQLLAGGNLERAQTLAQQLSSGVPGVDLTTLNPLWLDTSVSRTFAFQTDLENSGGTRWSRTWIVYWGLDPITRLPWRHIDSYSTTLSQKE
jgi:general secretion pathway protein K